MSEERKTAKEIETQSLTLAGGHELIVQRGSLADVLRVTRPDGNAGISVTITAEGIHVAISGAGLTLKADGPLALEAATLALRGEQGVVIESGGEAHIGVAGALTIEGRSQTIRATRGDVQIRANDDVNLEGERIRLN